MRRLDNKTHVIILLGLIMGLTTVIIGMVLAIPTASIVIDSENVFYEVDDQGELTIQLQGIKKAVNLSDCEFQLKIPEDFDIATFINGSPVLELANTGLPTELVQKDTDFSMEFMVSIYNSTLLPIDYTLEVSASDIHSTLLIRPRWPSENVDLTGGGGAGLAAGSPYISSYYAYDRSKGSSALFRTYIYNPTPIQRAMGYIEHTIKGISYDNWVGKSPRFNHPRVIQGYQTYIAYDYLSAAFTAQDSKKYAFNAGDYDVTYVYAKGGGWSDGHYPTSSQGEFEFSISSGHPVFIVYFTNAKWYDHGYSNPASLITAPSQNWWNEYQVILNPILELSWNPPDGEDTLDLLDELRTVAKNSLGLDGNWLSTGETHKDHHGFDICAGFTGYLSDHTGRTFDIPDSHFVITGGPDPFRVPNSQMDNYIQHELSHCYGAYDRWDYEVWYGQPSVMSKPTGVWSRNDWGWIDYDIMYPARDNFDGF